MKKVSERTPRIVRREYEPLKPLTRAQRKDLEALAALPDDQIDTSDIPELPESVWREKGVRGMFYRPIKRPVTIRLDADVIEWLKEKAGPNGRGYQTAANRLLRARMLAELRPLTKVPKAKSAG